jgi:hypothetical protein
MEEEETLYFGRRFWACDIPLKLEFPSFYNVCWDKRYVAKDHWQGDECNVRFK